MSDKLKKILRSQKFRGNLIIIVVAAVLLELIAGVQYYYSRGLLEEELEKKAQMELVTKAIIVSSSQKQVESALHNHIWDMKRNIDYPDSMFNVSDWLIRYNHNLAGGGMAFAPNFYPQKGRLFEPFAFRIGKKIVVRQVAGPSHDYTQLDFFKEPYENDKEYWSKVYYDSSLTRRHLITYSLPIHNEQKEVIAILAMDIDTDWLGDTLNHRHIYPSSFDLLLSRQGDLIAGPKQDFVSKATVDHVISVINDSTVEKKLSKNGRHTIAEFTNPENGEKGYIFYANMKGDLKWQVAVVCYDREIYYKVRVMRRGVLLMMVAALLILSFIVTRFVKNNRRLELANLEKKRIDSELKIASDIQMQMLPNNKNTYAERSDIDISGSLIPAREVGGDIYDYYIRDEKLFFCIGDVSGKGVPSALLMAVIHTLFRSASAHENNPARLMNTINDTSCQGNDSNMFVTLFLGVLDLPTGRLRYCNAGHDKPIVLGKGLLPAKANLPVGLFADFKYEMQEELLEAGTTLFLYTDGLTEAKNTDGQQFGLANVMKALDDCAQAQPEELLAAMSDKVGRYVEGAEQSDDLTMLAIRYCPLADAEVLDETLTLKNDVRQVALLSSFVKDVTAKLGLESAMAKNVRLGVEEAVVNVIDYAYPIGTEGEVSIRAKANDKQLKFIISDSGAAFDPTEAIKADTTLSVEERPIGGLGILLVRELMDAINYERINGMNILTLIKTIHQ